MKIAGIILLTGAAVLGGRFLYTLNRASKKVVVQVSGRVHKVTLAGVEVVMNYNIKNPTKATIEMAAPLIRLSHNGKILASSSMSLVEIPEDVRSTNGRIKILPFKETGQITTSILLPSLSLLSAGANLLALLKKRLSAQSEEEPIKFEVETTSEVFTKVASFPYDQKEIISL